MKSLNDVIEILHKTDNIMRPCTPSKVVRIENEFKVTLPQEYKNFLLAMGKGADAFMRGASCFCDELYSLKDGAIELLAENNFVKPLSNDAFVFWMHQGYQFAFFLLTEGDNPPVYYYHEGKGQVDFILVAPSFTDFLYNELQTHQSIVGKRN